MRHGDTGDEEDGPANAGGAARGDGPAGASADAAEAQIARAARLCAALDRMPGALETADLVDRALAFLAQIRASAKALRAARLAVERPHREAAERAGASSRAAERALAETRLAVEARLAAAVRFHAEQDAADGLIETEAPPPPPAPPVRPTGAADPDPGGDDPTGLPQRQGANLPPQVSVPVMTTVAGMDRAALDLEALRHHFTDAELRRTAERHFKETGRRLAGVRYARRVAG